MYTLLNKVQTGYGNKRDSYPMVAGEIHKGMKRQNHGANNSLRPRAEVKNARVTYILSSTRSRPAMAPKGLPIQWLQGKVQRG
jgi:hypothetical protein